MLTLTWDDFMTDWSESSEVTKWSQEVIKSPNHCVVSFQGNVISCTYFGNGCQKLAGCNWLNSNTLSRCKYLHLHGFTSSYCWKWCRGNWTRSTTSGAGSSISWKSWMSEKNGCSKFSVVHRDGSATYIQCSHQTTTVVHCIFCSHYAETEQCTI